MTRATRALAALALLALAVGASADDPKRVAVLEFTGRGIDAELLQALTDRARTGALEQLRARGYLVMTRESIAMIVRELGVCGAEGECDVETGRNVGADLVVTGAVRSITGNLILDMRLHETRGGSLLGSASVEAPDQMGLVRKIPDAVTRMFTSGLAPVKLASEGSFFAPDFLALGSGVETNVKGGFAGLALGWGAGAARFSLGGVATGGKAYGGTARLAFTLFNRTGLVRTYVAAEGAVLAPKEGLVVSARGAPGVELAFRRASFSLEVPVDYLVVAPAVYRKLTIFGAVGAAVRF